MSLMESLRVRIGLPPDDTSKDDEIVAAKDSAFALMGNYCDRDFLYAEDSVEVFTHHTGFALPLRRYPIESIESIIDDKGRTYSKYHANALNGVIHLDSHWAFHQVSVTSSGGYDEDGLPSDLLVAFYSIFDQQYATIGGGASVAAGEIQSVTVFDVGTIRYNDGGAAASSAAGNSGFLPASATAILGNYMRYKC